MLVEEEVAAVAVEVPEEPVVGKTLVELEARWTYQLFLPTCSWGSSLSPSL